MGLRVNTKKSQEMRCGATSSFPLVIGTEAAECVHKFTFLDSCVSETGGTEEDIASRIAKTRATFAQLRPVWQSQTLARRVKLKLFRPKLKTVLLYGCEKVAKVILDQLQVFVNRCLRYILGTFLPKTKHRGQPQTGILKKNVGVAVQTKSSGGLSSMKRRPLVRPGVKSSETLMTERDRV